MSINAAGQTEFQFYRNKNWRLLNQWLGKSKTNFKDKIDFTYFSPNDENVSKALLHAAYQYCFEFWGYSFTYSENAQQMRRVLAGEIDYPIKSVCSFNFENVDSPVPEGICIVQKPEPWRTYVVNIPTKLKQTGYKCTYSVLLPPPIENGWAHLGTIGRLLESKPQADVTILPLFNRYEQFTKGNA